MKRQRHTFRAISEKEYLEFAKRTEEAWKRIKERKGIKMDFDEFIKEMKRW